MLVLVVNQKDNEGSSRKSTSTLGGRLLESYSALEQLFHNEPLENKVKHQSFDESRKYNKTCSRQLPMKSVWIPSASFSL